MIRKSFTLLIHIALIVIIIGAMCTHFFGIQGEVTIADGDSTTSFRKTSGPGNGQFPFEITLVSADVEFYPGTSAPRDFKSVLRCGDRTCEVSMNKPATVGGWRFYQSGMGAADATFTVSHDPWGITITYIGYAMMAIGLVGFFFQKSTAWRSLLKKGAIAALLLFTLPHVAGAAQLPTMQRPLASDFGKVYVYWNDRVCPMQTMARDVTRKLYGSGSYRGMTSEQVLAGWLFYFEEWMNDYVVRNPAINGTVIDKSEKKLLEQKMLISAIGTGEAFRIFPYMTTHGYTQWLSLSGRRPSQMSLEQWQFMLTAMPRIKRLLLQGKNIKADEEIKNLIQCQRKYAGEDNLPSELKIKAEIFYNHVCRPMCGGILAFVLSIWYLYMGLTRRKRGKVPAATCTYILASGVIGIVALSWWIGGHIPLSNGTEMMLFMAAATSLAATMVSSDILKGALLLVTAMSLTVAGMAATTPRIGTLMPVLASPLLSIHVLVIMCAYAMFILMATLSAIALLSRDPQRRKELARVNRLILVPSTALLAIGIMIGAVWANQTWGRYWGWDPKETCSLIMLLVYSLPLHWAVARMRRFRQPNFFHRYILLALLTVLLTYFGANFIIPGLHSYA